MAAVYARFKDQGGSWNYEKVGKGRPPKNASFHVRFTDATGKRRWSRPFKSVEDANANSEGVKIASEAAARGLTVAEFKDTLNAGKTTVKDAVEAFLKLKKRKRPKTVSLYTNALNHPLNICQRVCGSLVILQPPMLSTNTSKFWSTRASAKRPSTRAWALSS